MPKPSHATDIRDGLTAATTALTEQKFRAEMQGAERPALEEFSLALIQPEMTNAEQVAQARTAETLRLSIANTSSALTNQRFSIAMADAGAPGNEALVHLPTVEFTGQETGNALHFSLGYRAPFDDGPGKVDLKNLFGRDSSTEVLDAAANESQILRTTADGTSRADGLPTLRRLTDDSAADHRAAETRGRLLDPDHAHDHDRDESAKFNERESPDTVRRSAPGVGTAIGAAILLEAALPWFKIPPQQRSKYYTPPNS